MIYYQLFNYPIINCSSFNNKFQIFIGQSLNFKDYSSGKWLELGFNFKKFSFAFFFPVSIVVIDGTLNSKWTIMKHYR